MLHQNKLDCLYIKIFFQGGPIILSKDEGYLSVTTESTNYESVMSLYYRPHMEDLYYSHLFHFVIWDNRIYHSLSWVNASDFLVGENVNESTNDISSQDWRNRKPKSCLGQVFNSKLGRFVVTLSKEFCLQMSSVVSLCYYLWSSSQNRSAYQPRTPSLCALW